MQGNLHKKFVALASNGTMMQQTLPHACALPSGTSTQLGVEVKNKRCYVLLSIIIKIRQQECD
eukprot:3942505-Amphidinium_carterae.1